MIFGLSKRSSNASVAVGEVAVTADEKHMPYER
jgi:hypothetical protein